jgi:acetyl-CoA carboxylase carboxyltransferase component
MAVLESGVQRDELFERRRERMEGLVAELRERSAQVAQGGGEKATERHRSRGKLTARERVDRLVDPGGAFLELNALAAWDVYDGQAPAAGIVTGIGIVEGRECVIVANDATVKGGSYFPLTVKKHLRAQEVPSFLSRTKSSRTEITSAASSSTRRACRQRASRRSRL